MDDEGAEFDALFRAEYPRVVSAVRWIVGNTAVAEEIAQDAFCRALERWNSMDPDDADRFLPESFTDPEECQAVGSFPSPVRPHRDLWLPILNRCADGGFGASLRSQRDNNNYSRGFSLIIVANICSPN